MWLFEAWLHAARPPSACGLIYGALKVANDNLDGNTCTGSRCYDGGRVITVFTVIFGALALGFAGPSAQAIFSVRAAAFDVFNVIKRDLLIDPLSDDGKKLPSVTGAINIENVTFVYPSRPEVHVCSNYNLSIKTGETVALVGPNGSGKSTIVSLLERFYDLLSGCVKIDGVDVRELNVKWLREKVRLVGQEPALFATSIMENIRYGAPSDAVGIANRRQAMRHDDRRTHRRRQQLVERILHDAFTFGIERSHGLVQQ